MIRKISLYTVLLCLFAAGANGVNATHLRSDTTIESDVIRLSDLFGGLKKGGHLIVAAAPPPGSKVSFSAARLQRIANRAGIDWRAQDRYQRTIVRRLGRAVKKNEIEPLVLKALRRDGLPPYYRVSISGDQNDMLFTGNLSARVTIADAEQDIEGKRFSAFVEFPGGDNRIKRHRISGSIYEVLQVPVLVRQMRRGAKISRNDVNLIEIRRDEAPAGIISEESEIIGKSPRRLLRQGVPVRSADLREPVIVSRGKIVTIVLRAKNMLLTARGRALDDGAKGDVIRIRNNRSNSTIEGIVTAPGRVTVEMPG